MLTITQNSKMGEGDLAPEKLRPYASIMPGGVMYGKSTNAPPTNGMGMSGSAINQSFAAPAVQPETAVFGDPNPPNPAAVSGMAPKGIATSAQPGGLWAGMSEQERIDHSLKHGTPYAQNMVERTQNQIQNDPRPYTGFNAGDSVGNNEYDSYINKSFQHSMRTLDPMIQQNEARFDQSMIDKGFAPGSEGYTTAFDNNSRRYNDLIAAASNAAMGFGSNRLDSDRQYGLQRDTFDLNELSTFDNMNRAWDDIGYRNAVFNTSREDQQFNQMLSLFGMTPVGTTVPTNTSSNFANSANSQLNALNANNQFYGQAAQGITDSIDALSDIDWSSIFGNSSSGSSGRGGGF